MKWDLLMELARLSPSPSPAKTGLKSGLEYYNAASNCPVADHQLTSK